MKFTKAQRSSCKIKMSVAGPSGSGKTYGALKLAKGLVGDWTKVGILDTENGSANLYSQLGPYSTLTIDAPFSVDKYIDGIKAAEQSGLKCLVIDSLSHGWLEILEMHGRMQQSSFQAWNRLTPVYNKLLQAILQSNLHIIATLRSKSDYAVNIVNGKAVPEKLGLKPIARDGVEYEFSVAFDLDHSHMAKVSKDRTGLFKDQVGLELTEDVGKAIAEWCNPPATEPRAIKEIMPEVIQDPEITAGLRKMLNNNHIQNGKH